MPPRISAKDLPPHLRKQLETQLSQPKATKGTSRDPAVELTKAIESLKTCQHEVLSQPNRFIFRFIGARLLSLNAIYRLHHMQRKRYKDAWHSAVQQAALLGRAEHGYPIKVDGQCRIEILRYSKRFLDVDNIVPKPLIDGLRHAGVILEDDPTVVTGVLTENAHGNYAVEASVIYSID